MTPRLVHDVRQRRAATSRCLAASAVLTLFIASCSYGIKARTDYDRTVNFSRYDTYFVVRGNSSGDPVRDERIASALQLALASMGWAEVPRGEGQAVVIVHAATSAKHSYAAFYENWGGWRLRPERAGTMLAEEYPVGTLVVDIFDATTRQAIWHGVATGAFSERPPGSTKVTDAAFRKMFSRFPSPY
jgi:hypothetical protein